MGMYSEEVVQRALALVGEGFSPARVSRMMGGVPSAGAIARWRRSGRPGRGPRRVGRVFSVADRLEAVRRVAAGESVAQVAAAMGCSTAAVRNWRRRAVEEPMAFMKDDKLPEGAGSKDIDALDDDPALLKELLKRTALERDIAVEMAKILGKGEAAQAAALPNRDKARLVMALAGRWTAKAACKAVALASSTWHEHRARLASPRRGEDRWGAWRVLVVDCFRRHRAKWGYRRIWKETGVPEHAVRSIMAEENLVVSTRRRRKASSYDPGKDTTRAPNVPLLEGGRHDFARSEPNRLWLSDVTEFALPDDPRRVCLSPVYDCCGGFIVAWRTACSMGSRELTDPSLEAALDRLAEDGSDGRDLTLHTDRGAQYHAASWKALLASVGATQSMSRKATSGDNAPMEGFFGLMKNEFFHGEDWRGVRAEEFARRLDEWIVKYNNEHRQRSLGWKTPAQHRAEAFAKAKANTNKNTNATNVA